MELELVLSLRPELSQDLSPGEEFVSLCLVQCSGSLYGVKVSIVILHLQLENMVQNIVENRLEVYMYVQYDSKMEHQRGFGPFVYLVIED